MTVCTKMTQSGQDNTRSLGYSGFFSRQLKPFKSSSRTTLGGSFGSWTRIRCATIEYPNRELVQGEAPGSLWLLWQIDVIPEALAIIYINICAFLLFDVGSSFGHLLLFVSLLYRGLLSMGNRFERLLVQLSGTPRKHVTLRMINTTTCDKEIGASLQIFWRWFGIDDWETCMGDVFEKLFRASPCISPPILIHGLQNENILCGQRKNSLLKIFEAAM